MISISPRIPALMLLTAVATLVGCSTAGADDETNDNAGAQSTAMTFASGTYDSGALHLVVNGNRVSGRVDNAVGDPAHGGATCAFTFHGRIHGNDKLAAIFVHDGFEGTPGTLSMVAGTGADPIGKHKVEIKLASSPNACDRVYGPALVTGYTFTGSAPVERGILGFRSVRANRAFFYDDVSAATPSGKYVIQGDTIVVTGPNVGVVVPAKSVSTGGHATTGFLLDADLATSAATCEEVTTADTCQEYECGWIPRASNGGQRDYCKSF